MTPDLLEAVDALTLPKRTKIPQTIEVDGVDRDIVTTIHHAPLLTQLEEAIASTIGAGGGRSMTAAWALSVLDSDALYQFTGITSQIRDWCRMAGVKADRHPADNLRAWYTSRLALTDRDDTGYTTILRRWENTIRAKLNPPRKLELTDPCPACHATEWEDPDGNIALHPVHLEYREGEPDVLQKARALCKSCGAEWVGSQELRALRWDQDQVAAGVSV